MEIALLPEQIKNHVKNMQYEQSAIGLSQAQIYRFYDTDNVFYLKISITDNGFRREHDLLHWLNGKMPVPEVKFWQE